MKSSGLFVTGGTEFDISVPTLVKNWLNWLAISRLSLVITPFDGYYIILKTQLAFSFRFKAAFYSN